MCYLLGICLVTVTYTGNFCHCPCVSGSPQCLDEGGGHFWFLLCAHLFATRNKCVLNLESWIITCSKIPLARFQLTRWLCQILSFPPTTEIHIQNFFMCPAGTSIGILCAQRKFNVPKSKLKLESFQSIGMRSTPLFYTFKELSNDIKYMAV